MSGLPVFVKINASTKVSKWFPFFVLQIGPSLACLNRWLPLFRVSFSRNKKIPMKRKVAKNAIWGLHRILLEYHFCFPVSIIHKRVCTIMIVQWQGTLVSRSCSRSMLVTLIGGTTSLSILVRFLWCISKENNFCCF